MAAIQMYKRKAMFSARIATVAEITPAEVSSSPSCGYPIERIG